MTAAADGLDLLRGPSWANRLAVAPLTNKQSNLDGTLGDDERRWLVARAQGGFGLVMSCATYVAPEGQAWVGQLGISDDRHVPASAGWPTTCARPARSPRCSCTTVVCGPTPASPACRPSRRGTTSARASGRSRRRRCTAPSTRSCPRPAGPSAPASTGSRCTAPTATWSASSSTAGTTCARTGTADRPSDRSRFLLEILEGIRQTTGPDFQLGLRVSPERFGIDLDEATTLVGAVMAGGHLDYLDLSLWDARKEPHGLEDDGLLLDRFAALPRHGVRLGYAGKILSAADVAWCLEQAADFVTIGTGAIIHHDFARRVLADPGFVSIPHPVSPGPPGGRVHRPGVPRVPRHQLGRLRALTTSAIAAGRAWS